MSDLPQARTGPRSAALAVVLLLAASALAGCTRSAAPPACVSTAGPSSAASLPVGAAPTGSLKVVEKGFTQIADTRGTVMLGAVVQNSSTLVAYRVPVTFRVLDAAGRAIAHPTSLPWLRVEIPVLMPGQRIGVAAVSDVVRDPRTDIPVPAATFEADLGAPQWWPRDTPGHRFAQVTAQTGDTLHGHSSTSTGEVAFTAHSPYCDPLLRRGIATLFRDSHGALVGGSFAADAWRVPDPERQQKCYSGTFTGTAQLWGIPAKADDRRTEVYLYCDITNPPAPAGSSSTAPIN